MTKRMGGLGKLSDFGKTNQPQAKTESPDNTASQADPVPTNREVLQQSVEVQAEQPKEKLVTVNIKITQSQQEWLSDTARDIRSNNSSPVPPNERVFPQHLIGVAIDLLKASNVDWSQTKNAQDLRKFLNL